MFRRWLSACCLILLLNGCGSDDPAEELRNLIDEAEIAAEDRQTSYFRRLLSDAYSDAHGNDSDRMIDLIRGYFLTHQSVEIFTRVQTVDLIGTDVAEISVVAGVLGQRSGAAFLGGFEGQLYDLELEFVRRSGDWQVIGAGWERSLETWDND